jgi:hypothetical protein
MVTKKLLGGTPSITLDDIERHNLPCVTLSASVPGFLYDQNGNGHTPTTIPERTKLVNFFRDVAEIWRAKYGGDPIPVDVLFPDGRFVHMTAGVDALLKIVPEQESMEWVTETQRYERSTK